MSIIAAFLWQKSPKQHICTLMFDADDLTIYSKPKKFTFSKKLFSFKKETKRIINQFMEELINLSETYEEKIIVEFKIVFIVHKIYWMKPAPESKIVYTLFLKAIKKLQKKYSNIILKPQLRRKLSGKNLIKFKHELRKMELVSRKKTRGFEYYLWAVALHATPQSFENTLQMIRKKLINKYWNQPI